MKKYLILLITVLTSVSYTHLIHTCLPQDITVETLHGRFAQSALYHTVATASEIQHAIWFLSLIHIS